MKTSPSALLALSILLTGSVIGSLPAEAQTLVATVPVGVQPLVIAHNAATNKIYVANYCGNDENCLSDGGAFGTVTVIDGASNGTTTVAVGADPYDIQTNPVTNKIYEVDNCGSDLSCQSAGTVTVIDGATNTTTTIPVGYYPFQAAVNSVTNQIYVSDSGDGIVTVINGATNQTQNVQVGDTPLGLAVNPVTNKIYVPNYYDNTVTIIDGATLTTSTVNVGLNPYQVAVNSLANQIYVVNQGDNTVTQIDGVTNQTHTISVGAYPYAIAINEVTNLVYVANADSNTVTVINGGTLTATNVTSGYGPLGVTVGPVTNDVFVANSVDNTMAMIDGANNHVSTFPGGMFPDAIDANVVTNLIYVANAGGNSVSVYGGPNAGAIQFVALPPCRLVDTRPEYGGSGPIQGGTSENFPLPQEGSCGAGIPLNVAAYSLNVTAIPSGRLGYLTIWPTGEDQPFVSLMNSLDGRVKANAAIVPAGYQGSVSVFVNNTSNVAIDINGYFVPANGSTLAFYPLTPCRVVDTRDPTRGNLGAPSLVADQERDFPVTQSSCIPQDPNIKAYSFNVTAVPEPDGQRLGFLTVWPQGGTLPNVSTLNNPTGTIVANAAIVPAGINGGVAVFPNDTSDLVMDINGYFAAPGAGGLSLYPSAPCRVLDTRQAGGPFMGELTVNVASSQCRPPAGAQAYVLNATVVPQPTLGFLTLWPDGQQQPDTSTLNAKDGAITSNLAILSTTNGSIDSYANALTQMILDISSYFAP